MMLIQMDKMQDLNHSKQLLVDVIRLDLVNLNHKVMVQLKALVLLVFLYHIHVLHTGVYRNPLALEDS